MWQPFGGFAKKLLPLAFYKNDINTVDINHAVMLYQRLLPPAFYLNDFKGPLLKWFEAALTAKSRGHC